MFKTLGAAAIGLAVFAIPAFAAHDQAEATKAVSTFTDNYTKAFNAKDVTAIVAMFAPDGVEAGPGPMLTSRDDIEKRFKTIFNSGATDHPIRHQASASRRQHRVCGWSIHGQGARYHPRGQCDQHF